MILIVLLLREISTNHNEITLKKYIIGIVLLTVVPVLILKLVGRSTPAASFSTAEKTFQPEPTPLFNSYEGKIKKGETLESILLNYKVPRREAYTVIKSFKNVFDVRHLRPGKTYTLFTDTTGKVQKFVYQPDIETRIVLTRDGVNNYTSKKQTIDLVKLIQGIQGTVKTSLYEAIIELGEKPELIVMFSDIFQWDIDFFIDPRAGDEFKILYEAAYLPDSTQPNGIGEFVRYTRILAGQYSLHGKPLTAIYFDNKPAKAGYYDPEGKSFQKTFLKSPLNYRRISSYFSLGRIHPILKIRRPHYGVDFAAPRGTPVVASADGTVIARGYKSGIGNYIKIRHKNQRFVTLYGHLSKFAKGVQKGVRVNQRQVIGYVGSTGLATGPHLHYTFYDNGRPIDPLKIKNTSGDPILTKNKDAFLKVKTEMLLNLESIGTYPVAQKSGDRLFSKN